jgi:hypothetical protein
MKRFDLENDPKIPPGFKVPDGYFEQFEASVMNRLPEREVKVVSLWQRTSVWVSGAAAVFIIAIGTWLFFVQDNTENTISSQEYLAYENDITTEDIAHYLTDDDITAIEKELNLYDRESETYINEYIN